MLGWHKRGVMVYNSEQKAWHLVYLPTPQANGDTK